MILNKINLKNLPSFLDTTLRGLKALRALKPLMKETSVLMSASRIHVRIEKHTMTKSRMFHGSLRYVLSPK